MTAHRSTPAELQARLEAERRGAPFLVFHDGAGRQVIRELSPGTLTVGRGADCDVALGWDREVSRLHAQLEAVGGRWVLVDDGLSRNGSFVNGARVVGRRVLNDGDRLVFGETPVILRAPAAGDSSTVVVSTGPAAVMLTPTQRRILVALCRPVRESAFATPATNREIAAELFLSVDAVKAHLRALFERFGLEDLPQNQKRARLAAVALLQGIVTARD
ncbi:MAG TPA: FHA domain-containing protein [Solirubrobacteraceae bacterium]|jgi:pSer/pThr/pTyr-binding forkhead associated (FHA) protein|nr:FHA domain-containing protein [Solirubrobacteraceae bacterium]